MYVRMYKVWDIVCLQYNTMHFDDHCFKNIIDTTYTNVSIISPDDSSGRMLNDAVNGELVGGENKTGEFSQGG